MAHRTASRPARRPYATPRLIEHGTVESLTEGTLGGGTFEKHPLPWKKGSKIRPR